MHRGDVRSIKPFIPNTYENYAGIAYAGKARQEIIPKDNFSCAPEESATQSAPLR
jgi:hypothetical protein